MLSFRIHLPLYKVFCERTINSSCSSEIESFYSNFSYCKNLSKFYAVCYREVRETVKFPGKGNLLSSYLKRRRLMNKHKLSQLSLNKKAASISADCMDKPFVSMEKSLIRSFLCFMKARARLVMHLSFSPTSSPLTVLSSLYPSSASTFSLSSNNIFSPFLNILRSRLKPQAKVPGTEKTSPYVLYTTMTYCRLDQQAYS